MKKLLLVVAVVFATSLLKAQSTFTQINSLFQNSCAIGCHNGVDNSGNLNLSGTDSEVYNRLVNVSPTNPAAAAKGYKLIRPGYPDRSFLMRKCNNGLYPNEALTIEEGSGMPNYGGPVPAIPQQNLEMIRQWIYQGAPLTGNVVNTAIIDEYYTNGGINSIPSTPPLPTEAGSFQLHLGKIFLAPQSEAEYFIKYDLELPENIKVNRLEMIMAPQSHHFILYKFLPGQDASFNEGLRLQNPITGVGSSGSSSTMINAWQMSFDTHLPEGTAYIWPTGSVLDMNFHLKNYSVDSILASEVFINVYTVPSTDEVIEMHSDLITDLNIFIPADNTPHTFSQGDYDNSATNYWNIWQLTSHTHKYGIDFDIYKRNANGTKGEQIYEGWYDTDYIFNQGYYSFSHPPIRQFEPLETINPKLGLIQEATFRNSGSTAVHFGLTTNDEMKLYYIQYTLGDVILGDENLTTDFASIIPNPANGNFNLTFDLEKASDVQISIWDISGRLIQQTNPDNLPIGKNSLQLQAPDKNGVYIIRLCSNTGTFTQKLIVQH
jgi:hypothetical protein